MRSLHLTLLAFCQLLIVSFVLYSSSIFDSATALPFNQQPNPLLEIPPKPETSKVVESVPVVVEAQAPVHKEAEVIAPRSNAVVEPLPAAPGPVEKAPIEQPKVGAEQELQPKMAFIGSVVAPATRPALESHIAPVLESTKTVAAAVLELDKQIDKVLAEVDRPQSQLEGRKIEPAPVVQEVSSKVEQAPVEAPVLVAVPKVEVVAPAVPVQADPSPVEVKHAPASAVVEPAKLAHEQQPVAAALVAETKLDGKFSDKQAEETKKADDSQIVGKAAEVEVAPRPAVEPLVASVSVVEPAKSPVKEETIVKVVHALPVAEQAPVVKEPLVNGGLGPLYLLASTLCNQTLEQPPADEHLSALYNRRAGLRKSLFEYMSLKFTHLEKLSSKLNGGLVATPVKASPGVSPSHGWPVVGRCTAYDLKLMAEAAWCDSSPIQSQPVARPLSASLDPIKVLGRKRRSADSQQQMSQDQDAIAISKILYMSDINNSPGVESTIASLNLNPQELSTFRNSLEDYKCRRIALKMAKSLFEHLAEDQRNVSETWPHLFATMSRDECARKRMIDVVNALAGFQGEASSIRRDNLEFAFAVDDLRAKVLESDLNKPLTFDKQFIEVEQFLQQSVRLMLANIDPERARLTSLRYRSLMTNDQCIELHQRLLNKNYPTDCNPIEFGQLPDVLRMTANSLELWSIEKEIGSYATKSAQSVSFSSRDEVNECIANLVAK